MTGITFEYVAEPTEEELAFFEALREFNEAHVGDSSPLRLTVFARDESGRIVGGLRGMSAWSWMHITFLVVCAEHRGIGLGTRLVELAEEEALRRGCLGMHLETASFQALPFYEKMGYSVFGQIEDCPPGHVCYFLSKRFV